MYASTPTGDKRLRTRRRCEIGTREEEKQGKTEPHVSHLDMRRLLRSLDLHFYLRSPNRSLSSMVPRI